MTRRENYRKTLQHQSADALILDLGGCPLSSMEGQSRFKLMEFLGIPHEDNRRALPFGQGYRLDERLLQALDIDTRAVGEILARLLAGHPELKAAVAGELLALSEAHK